MYTIIQVLDQVFSKLELSPKKNFLEIGTYYGRSLIPILHRFVNYIDSFYSCDFIFWTDFHEKRFDENFDKLIGMGYRGKLKKLKMDSSMLWNHEWDGNNQFLFCAIDGGKLYENAISDLQFCANHLEPNGIISIDSVFLPTCPGIQLALYDFLKANADFSVTHILFRKVIISRNASIREATFDPENFTLFHINGKPVNVVNREIDESIDLCIAQLQ